MPCNDVSEQLELTLDAADCVESFWLKKNTCGAPVGNGLLINYVAGLSAQALLKSSVVDLVPEIDRAKRIDQFLLTKQLFALHEALAAFTGAASGGKDQAFTVEKIEYCAEKTLIAGLVRIDILTDKINACKSCCCAPKPAAARAATVEA